MKKPTTYLKDLLAEKRLFEQMQKKVEKDFATGTPVNLKNYYQKDESDDRTSLLVDRRTKAKPKPKRYKSIMFPPQFNLTHPDKRKSIMVSLNNNLKDALHKKLTNMRQNSNIDLRPQP